MHLSVRTLRFSMLHPIRLPRENWVVPVVLVEGCVRLSLSVVGYIIEVSAGAVMVVGLKVLMVVGLKDFMVDWLKVFMVVGLKVFMVVGLKVSTAVKDSISYNMK